MAKVETKTPATHEGYSIPKTNTRRTISASNEHLWPPKSHDRYIYIPLDIYTRLLA